MAQLKQSKTIPFTEEEKRMLVEGTDKYGNKLSEKEKMRLSKMHTEKTIGSDWRERGAEALRMGEAERAQQALNERSAINKSTTPADIYIPKKADEWQNIPGGGKVKIGEKTLANMRKFEEDKARETQAREAKQNEKIDAYAREKYGTLQKRYEDELASRGFTPPKTRQEEEAITRAKMDEFRVVSEARNLAKEKLNTSQKDYKYYNSLAAQAMASGNAKQAEDLMRAAQATGGSIKNYSARSKFLEDQEMSKAKALISEKTKARIAKMQAQNTSNPEASSFTPTNLEMSVSGTAPFGVGSAIPSYQLPYQKPSGPTEQPFGMTTPAMVDSGVDFSSISPYNAAETRITETTSEAVSPTTRGVMPTAKTSKDQSIEDVFPGISNMPVVQRNPKETPAQHNTRVQEEYTNNVIIPSFDDATQNALQSAIDLNKQKDELFGVRLTSQENIKKYKDISGRLNKEQDVLKKTRDKLRSEKRNLSKYPMNSKERQFLDLQIATLQNQLSFLGKMF
jgi:hypothetical protein